MLPKSSPESWFVGAKFDHGPGSSLWPEIHSSSRNAHDVHDRKFYVGQPSGADFIAHKLTDARLDGDSTVPDTVVTEDKLITDVTAAPQRVIQVGCVHAAAWF